MTDKADFYEIEFESEAGFAFAKGGIPMRAEIGPKTALVDDDYIGSDAWTRYRRTLDFHGVKFAVAPSEIDVADMWEAEDLDAPGVGEWIAPPSP